VGVRPRVEQVHGDAVEGGGQQDAPDDRGIDVEVGRNLRQSPRRRPAGRSGYPGDDALGEARGQRARELLAQLVRERPGVSVSEIVEGQDRQRRVGSASRAVYRARSEREPGVRLPPAVAGLD
jgi:hypothetical protein